MTPDQLKAFRESLGWTQQQLADALGMAPNSVARLERGERPITKRTVAQLETLAKTTG